MSKDVKDCKSNQHHHPTMNEDNLMRIEEVAKYLRVQKRTVYDWVRKGKIPAIKTVGQWRFKKDKIDEWLETQK